jgi:predicted Zn finger-like uncharacterized protein
MILTCPHCAVRLQMEMEHLSAQPITVRCPKCQHTLSVVPVPAPPTPGQRAPGAAGDNGEGAARNETPAPASSAAPGAPASDTAAGGAQDAVQALIALLSQALNRPASPPHDPQERRRCVLACLALDAERGRVREALRGHEYDLLIAESTERAIELLQHSRLVDVLLIDESFEAEQNGTTTVMRYVNSFHLGRRRRLYVALVTPRHRTLDTQSAFALGVNVLVNAADLSELPAVLNKSIREYNLLYRAFNEASGGVPF